MIKVEQEVQVTMRYSYEVPEEELSKLTEERIKEQHIDFTKDIRSALDVDWMVEKDGINVEHYEMTANLKLSTGLTDTIKDSLEEANDGQGRV